jgi:hypothetical protein
MEVTDDMMYKIGDGPLERSSVVTMIVMTMAGTKAGRK